MPALLRKRTEIRDHWFATAHDLGKTLPGSADQYRPRHDDTIATLIHQQYPDETASRSGGRIVPVVPLLETLPGESPVHWLGWHEEWREPTSRASRALQFRASSLTLYFGLAGAPKRQFLRAEWAGVLQTTEAGDVFQAHGAAHPHWHVDGVRGYFDDLDRRITELENLALPQDRPAGGEIQDFGSDLREGSSEVARLFKDLPLPRDSELAWTGIHLAANAKWEQLPWLGAKESHDTHAAGPRELRNIRNWLVSCARYLQTQIQEQLLRNRRA